MKKTGSIYCFMFALLFTLTGCSSVSRENSKASDMHTIHTAMGEIEVPKEARRVVVNWYIGDVLSLDLNVVGYHAWEQETMPFYDKFSSDAKLENWAAEDIMAAEPDLIITYQTEDLKSLEK